MRLQFCALNRNLEVVTQKTSIVPLETTGISFSPDGKHLYFAFQVRSNKIAGLQYLSGRYNSRIVVCLAQQEDGYLFDVTRTDGLSFFGPAGSAPVDCANSLVAQAIQNTWNSFRSWLFPPNQGT